MRILAIDYGAKRIGLAISDASRVLAQPLSALPNDQHFLPSLRKLVQENDVGKLVLGHPLRLDQQAGEAAAKMAEVAQQLEQELGLPVELHDERLTSAEAEEELKKIGVKKERRKQLLDAVAAALILRSYLESHKE